MAWLGTAALVVGGTASATAATPTPPAPLLSAAGAETVPGEYVVVLKDDGALRSTGLRTTAAPDRVKAAAEAGRKLGGTITRQFNSAIQGYAAKLSGSELDAIRKDPTVAYIQPNQVIRSQQSTEGQPAPRPIKAAGVATNPESWGLDRIDQRNLPLNKQYYWTSTGVGVTAFIVDSGIATGQPDFNQLRAGVNTTGDTRGTNDCYGHGTHVAGTVGGGVYGVAKDVTLVPIRVLNCSGGGDTSTVVAGLDAVINMGVSGPKVVNMSLGSSKPDAAVDAAVKKVIAAGITVVIAAGNDGVSACGASPARVKTAITVGSTNRADKRSTFSNFASCVDLYAPGEKIVSDWKWPNGVNDGNWWINDISGTSMATPHVTGTVAMYLQRHPTATPAQVQAAVIATATKNKVTNVSSKWPRLELFGLQAAPRPKSVTSGNKLKSGQSLVHGNKICSSNKAYCLSPEASGKLVLRKVTGTKKVVWSAGAAVYWTTMTATGPLSAYDGYARRVWTSKKTGGKSTLFVNSNGYLAVVRDSDKKVLWRS